MTNTTTDLRRETTTTDVGLLILRIAIGATMLQAGLVKAVNFDTTAGFMESGGWRLPTLAALMVTVAETLGGIGLLLGVLTPLAAFAVISAMIDAWAVNVSAGVIWSEPFNVPFLVVFATIGLLFTGAGTLSVDHWVFGRANGPRSVAVTMTVAGFVVAVVTWVALNGTNPIHFTD
ncbi:DoxX family protein [Mycobacterium sp. 155]|uniref:DoxX family protein n=1 Tax=Mycobacterium sp. 155 TaxID=1157943 RepID=UPI000373137F|nr:DoxX family protein [Mycobacterium sp. 155]